MLINMNKEIDKIHSITYNVDTNYVNFNKKLGLYGMLGFIQDIAAEHAELLGFGYKDMIAKNIFWVIIRQKLVMYSWPNWRDELKIVTWTKPVEGLNLYREFELFVNDVKIGECSTTWMILDGNSRRPTKPDFYNDDKFARNDYGLNIKSERIKIPDEMTKLGIFKVFNSDIDMNYHVNNTRYSKWILDSIPIKYHKSVKLREFEINFLGESFLDDEIAIVGNNGIETTSENQTTYYAGIRESDNKKVFAAKLIAEHLK